MPGHARVLWHLLVLAVLWIPLVTGPPQEGIFPKMVRIGLAYSPPWKVYLYGKCRQTCNTSAIPGTFFLGPNLATLNQESAGIWGGRTISCWPIMTHTYIYIYIYICIYIYIFVYMYVYNFLSHKYTSSTKALFWLQNMPIASKSWPFRREG